MRFQFKVLQAQKFHCFGPFPRWSYHELGFQIMYKSNMTQNAASMTLQGRDKADMENKVTINCALNFLTMTLKHYHD